MSTFLYPRARHLPRRVGESPSATRGSGATIRGYVFDGYLVPFGEERPGDWVDARGPLAEPPGPDMFTEPRHRFIARLPDPDEAASALVELTSAGFRTDEFLWYPGTKESVGWTHRACTTG